MKAPSGLPAVTQLLVLTNHAPTPTKTTMIATLITTMMLFTRAESWTPTISSADIAAITAIAGTLSNAPVKCHTRFAGSYAKGDWAYRSGTTIPKSLSRLTA